MSRKLALSFRKHHENDLSAIASIVTYKLADNAHFPDVTPLLSPVRETGIQLREAVVDASLGDTLKILIKNDIKEKLIVLLRELGEYVEKHANGDDAVLASSGFRMAKPRKEISLQDPAEFMIMPGKNNGEIIMQAKRVKGAKAYMYQYTSESVSNETKWETINSTKRKIVLKQLPLGVQFFFRMAAIGARNQVVYTDVLTRYIA